MLYDDIFGCCYYTTFSLIMTSVTVIKLCYQCIHIYHVTYTVFITSMFYLELKLPSDVQYVKDSNCHLVQVIRYLRNLDLVFMMPLFVSEKYYTFVI